MESVTFHLEFSPSFGHSTCNFSIYLVFGRSSVSLQLDCKAGWQLTGIVCGVVQQYNGQFAVFAMEYK